MLALLTRPAGAGSQFAEHLVKPRPVAGHVLGRGTRQVGQRPGPVENRPVSVIGQAAGVTGQRGPGGQTVQRDSGLGRVGGR